MTRVLFLCLLACGTLCPTLVQGFMAPKDVVGVRYSDSPVANRLSIPDIFLTSSSNGTIIRGQDPSTFETPAIMAPPGMPWTGAMERDPFIYGPDPVLGGPFGGGTVLSGVNGPQPYRNGFTPRYESVYLGSANTSNPNVGAFQSENINFEVAYTTPLAQGVVFTNTPQLGIGLWSGPQTVDLPGSVYHLGWDFTLASPIAGPWSMQLDFNPSINSDFSSALNHDAVQLDANAMLFYRTSPQLMLVAGAGYWERVENIVLPYAGVVWNPNDLWEFRLLFPKTRISYFLGNIGNAAHWIYATGEYHVESYQITMPGVADSEKVQLSDYRIGLGLRSDHGWYDKSVEVGYVLGRQVEFLKHTPSFDINDTYMIRFAVRF